MFFAEKNGGFLRNKYHLTHWRISGYNFRIKVPKLNHRFFRHFFFCAAPRPPRHCGDFIGIFYQKGKLKLYHSITDTLPTPRPTGTPASQRGTLFLPLRSKFSSTGPRKIVRFCGWFHGGVPRSGEVVFFVPAGQW